MASKGTALGVIGAGSVFLWAGVKGYSVTQVIQDLVTGKPPVAPVASLAFNVVAPAQASFPLHPGTGSPGILAGGNSAIAADSLKYQGAGYTWGGPADVPGHWDCSSFVSYVLGHDLGMVLPGGGHYGDSGYPPHSHGPTTLQYHTFGTSVPAGQEQPGDLIVSFTHMGIVTGGGKYMSAHSPSEGTSESSYLGGFPGGTPVFRRV